MNRLTVALATVVALVVVTSIVAFPLFAGGDILPGSAGPGSVGSSDSTDPGAGGETTDTEEEPATPQESGLISMTATTPDPDRASLAQEKDEAIERGVDEAVEILQRQNVEITQEQRAAAIEGARESVTQHQSADVEQVQRAITGAVHGTLLQKQRVNATQIHSIVGGATGGALSQHQTANATQMQYATWGAAHGTAAQEQKVTVEQLQVAARGAAAGAAHEAGNADEGEPGKIQEAAQGAAYGVLDQYQKATVEQRHRLTVEHVQNAAAGASAGALEGSQRTVRDQSQRVQVEQRQRVTIKEIQKAAMGAAGGAIDQKQTVTVRQTQVAARGAAKGACKKVQTQRMKQVQKISISQIQEASYGAAKGSIIQSQDASIEQIQAAAEGSAEGVLQSQRVTVVQIQDAATGAAQGAVESAVQNQVVDVEQIQAAARGGGQGAVIQIQVVTVVQVQALARGASSGSLSQYQSASVHQIQIAAKSAGTSTAKAIQNQRVSVEQIQRVTETVAADTARHAVDVGTDDESELENRADDAANESVAAVEEVEGTATVSIADQSVQAQTVVVDSVQLSDGGYVVVHDDDAIVGPSADTVLGVSRYLAPGEHESVEIELAQPLADNRSVVAMAHRDTTGDQEFTFVESVGEEDGPYIDDSGSPVSERATLATPPEEAGDGVAEDDGDANQSDGATETDEIIDADETDETETDDGVNETDDGEDVPVDATGSLEIEDQSGDGTTLTVTEANASVAFAIRATYPGGSVESEQLDANESIDNATLDLEPPLEENATVNVSVVDVASGEPLVAEEIEYTVEGADEPTGELAIDDQSGDGTTLTVTEATASVDFYLEATYDDETVETDVFGAEETLENETVDLEPPLEENATVELAVRAAADDVELANASIEYVVREDPTAEIEFDDQVSGGSNVTVDAVNLSDGGYVTVYDASVLAEDPAPDEPLIEVSPEAVVGVSEYLEAGEYENLTVELFDVPGAEDERSELEPGDVTLVAVAHLETTEAVAADDPFAEPTYDYVETDGEEDGPYLDDEGVPVFDDADVTVEEPSDSAGAPEPAGSAADEGSTRSEGDDESGQPEGDDESTQPPGEGAAAQSATFAITDLSAPDSAQQGAGIDVVATIQNQGEEAATQTVSYAVDGQVLGQTEVTLGAGETILLTFEYVIPADYPTGAVSHTVETTDDAATTTVTVESAGGQAAVTAPHVAGTGTAGPG